MARAPKLSSDKEAGHSAYIHRRYVSKALKEQTPLGMKARLYGCRTTGARHCYNWLSKKDCLRLTALMVFCWMASRTTPQADALKIPLRTRS